LKAEGCMTNVFLPCLPLKMLFLKGGEDELWPLPRSVVTEAQMNKGVESASARVDGREIVLSPQAAARAL